MNHFNEMDSKLLTIHFYIGEIKMKCQKCDSERVARVSGKTSDLCFISIGENEKDGYVPYDMGIGGGDYIKFEYCLDCGQIQGSFPLDICELELNEEA